MNDPNRITAATLNIWGDQGPWAERCLLIVDEVDRVIPDILALQEVLRPAGPGTSQADQLAHRLRQRLPVYYGRAHNIGQPTRSSEFGNAILTHYTVHDHCVLPLTTPPGVEPRSALYLLLATTFGLLPVLTTHLSWEPKLWSVRTQQLALIRAFLADRLEEIPNRFPLGLAVFPPLLLGDLNAIPESAEIGEMTRQQPGVLTFDDTFAMVGTGIQETFSSRNPYCPPNDPMLNKRLDYILQARTLGSKHMVPASSSVCFMYHEDGTYCSDHFGVETCFTILR